MVFLTFHGYLLRGTGSNIYNSELARAMVGLGHEVHLLCQDAAAGELPFVDAVGRFEGGRLALETIREPVRCTAYLPDIGGLLPVYVADEYEGFEARTFAELSDEEVNRYLDANVAAVRAVAGRVRPDAALANHAIMGPAILARAIGGEVPYAVKIHGSALEYAVRPEPERFGPYAREGLEGANGVLVGSRHTAESLWELIDLPGLEAKTRLGPPGVDTEAFRPAPAAKAAAGLRELAGRLEGQGGGWGGDPRAAAALGSLDPAAGPIVSYVGKLIVSKGVDLLIAAWPLVAERFPEAQLAIIGFGTYREALERLAAALGEGDLDTARDIASRGRELEGGPPGELEYLAAFLREPPQGYPEPARGGMGRIAFTGRLEHGDLPPLLQASAAQVVPSTFPEAFGMVAAEAAACGALPVCAEHSGLAEMSAALAPALPPQLRPLLSFERGPGAVEAIAERLVRWLSLAPEEREEGAVALARTAREQYGWEGVVARVIDAARGRLDELPVPAPSGSARG